MLVTHYTNLRIAEDAPTEVVRAAYKALAQKWHPDKNPDNRELAEKYIQAINAAYAVLSDPEKRKIHDQWIKGQRAEQANPHIAPPSFMPPQAAPRKASTAFHSGSDTKSTPTQKVMAAVLVLCGIYSWYYMYCAGFLGVPPRTENPYQKCMDDATTKPSNSGAQIAARLCYQRYGTYAPPPAN